MAGMKAIILVMVLGSLIMVGLRKLSGIELTSAQFFIFVFPHMLWGLAIKVAIDHYRDGQDDEDDEEEEED